MTLHQGLAALAAMVNAVTVGSFLLSFLNADERAGLAFVAFVLSTGLAVVLGQPAPEPPRPPA